MEVCIVFYKDKPYKTKEGIKVFTDYQKAKNYKNNAIRHIGRLLCKNEPWYDMGEEKKQKWFDKAKKLLKIKSFIEIDDKRECWNCANYNIGDGIDDLKICYGCENYEE